MPRKKTIDPPEPAVPIAAPKENVVTNNRIITIDGRYRSDGDKKQESLTQLRKDQKTKKILTGIVSSIETTPTGMTFAAIYHGDFKVIIPASEIVDTALFFDPESEDDEYIQTRRFITIMMGAEIDFIIKGIDKDEMLITASRKEAMEITRNRFFKPLYARAAPMVTDGALTEARVIAVGFKRIYLDIFGVDTVIPAEEISWQWMADLHANFFVGSRIVTKILSISDNKKAITLTASIKQATPDPYIGAEQKFKPRSTHIGTITAVTDRGIYVSLPAGLDCLCPYPDWHRANLAPGSQVSVYIVKVDEEHRRIRGRVQRIINGI